MASPWPGPRWWAPPGADGCWMNWFPGWKPPACPLGDPGCREASDQPVVLRRMIKAAALLGEADFTPMAAVAGTFSDLAKEAALEAGADRVLVNNGGDISLAFGPGGAPFTVGLVSDLAQPSL